MININDDLIIAMKKKYKPSYNKEIDKPFFELNHLFNLRA